MNAARRFSDWWRHLSTTDRIAFMSALSALGTVILMFFGCSVMTVVSWFAPPTPTPGPPPATIVITGTENDDEDPIDVPAATIIRYVNPGPAACHLHIGQQEVALVQAGGHYDIRLQAAAPDVLTELWCLESPDKRVRLRPLPPLTGEATSVSRADGGAGLNGGSASETATPGEIPATPTTRVIVVTAVNASKTPPAPEAPTPTSDNSIPPGGAATETPVQAETQPPPGSGQPSSTSPPAATDPLSAPSPAPPTAPEVDATETPRRGGTWP